MTKTIVSAVLLVFITVAFFVAVIYGNKKNTEIISYNKFLENISNKEVSEVTLTESEKIEFKLKNDDTVYKTDNPRNNSLKEKLLLEGISVKESDAQTMTSLIETVVSLCFFGGAIFFVYKMSNRNNIKSAMEINLVDANTTEENKLSFRDVAGNEEAKESVQDIVDFIKNPDKYSFYGARIPRGIIFYGPPGTGKTLMAKAVAGESDVPFFAVSGSDFVQMYVGVGAKRIRQLFKKAREHGKAVIFIDEIDALGKKRAGSQSGGNDERDQTLNALLTEMSGFSSTDGIVVIAATNRLDTLDDALLRPGRFDRHVEIGLPDLNARLRILKHHSKNKPLSIDTDLNKLARDTVYFSGAMLENLLNEAAIFAAKSEKNIVTNEHIQKAYYTVLAGAEKKDRSNIKERERLITSIHEAGHALVAKITSPENIISKITIIPSTKGAGGFCVNIPEEKMYYTKKELESQIMVNFAGRAAEEIIFGEENITTGAGNDIEKATSIIKDYVTKYGMGEKTGLLNISLFNDSSTVISECSQLMEKLYSKTKEMILSNKDKLNNIANELMDKETLTHEDLERIVG